MMDILDRLRLKIQRIPAGSYHTCGDACTNTDCLLVGARQKIEELRDALACEMDDTRNTCAALNAEVERLRDAIERAGRCLVMSNNGAAEALAILRAAKRAADQPEAAAK